MNAKNINHMLIISFDVFAVNDRIASCGHIFQLVITDSVGWQRTTAQSRPLVFRVVIVFYRRFLFVFHGHDIYLSPGGP